MTRKDDDKQPGTVVSKISGLVGLYAVFVFLSGWTYLDYYYRTFGVYTRWLDISVPETFMKGFIILFEGGEWLWVVYVFILVVPILFEVFPQFRAHTGVQLALACVMLSCLPLTYYISKSVGSDAARQNQSTSTALADIRMETQCGVYLGKLLFVRQGTYYVHDAKLLPGNGSQKDCWEPSEANNNVHALTVFTSDKIQALEISEY